MDAPAHGHVYKEDPHRTGLREEGEEDHHEKNSVLKKVKNKAKKIKDTLSKKMHSNGHDQGQGYEEDDEDENDDNGEGMEEDPAIPGAAGNVNDSTAARIGVAGREEHPDHGGAPKGQSDALIPGSNQTNVTDSGSTGGLESGVTRSFQHMSVSEQPKGAEEYSTTESQDRFSPDFTPSTDHSLSEKPHVGIEKSAGVAGERHAEEKRSSTISTIVDKAPSAKDTAISLAWGSTEYGKKIASTVYEKVAGAGTAVLAKVQPGDTGIGGDNKGQQDKGVSVKEFLAEKLSPGEEDRALCEVISEVILKRKEEAKDVREEPIQKPREGAEGLVSGERNTAAPTGEGIVGKIKDAVTSLFAGGGASHAPPETGVQTGGAVERSSEKLEGRQLQESTN